MNTRNRKPWTRAEDEQLRDLAQNPGTRLIEMASALQRSPEAGQLFQLGPAHDGGETDRVASPDRHADDVFGVPSRSLVIVQVAALPNRAILVRLLLNQATRAEDAGRGRRALEIYERITDFAPDYGHAWWQRARLVLVDHDVASARRSLAAMLEVTRDPAQRATITETLRSLVAS